MRRQRYSFVAGYFFYMDLSGHWSFFENFEFGCDYGVAVLRQKGNTLTGTLVYTEHIYEDGEFIISVDVKGIVDEDHVSFDCVSYQLIDVPQGFDYYFDQRSGVLVDFDRIEGVSDDEQGIEGTFTMVRIL